MPQQEEYAVQANGVRVSTRDPAIWGLSERSRQAIADSILVTFQANWLAGAEAESKVEVTTEFAVFGPVVWKVERLT